MLEHGADPNRKNRDGQTPLDLARDADIKDILLGDAALLDASKKGCLERVKKLLTKENVNCRDVQGRNSTPLHLAAGYNNIEVATLLIEGMVLVLSRNNFVLKPGINLKQKLGQMSIQSIGAV